MEIPARVERIADSTGRGMGAHPQRAVASAGLGLLLLVAVVVIPLQIAQGLNGDTSWLISVGERWLDGSRPYVDVLETNPPMSVLMFLPTILLAQLTGVRPEAVLIVGVAALAVASAEATARALIAQRLADNSLKLRLALGFAVLVLPMSTFAEREHVAVIALMPIGAVLLARAEGRSPERWLILIGGLGAGLAMAIKPQFAAAVLLPALVVARSTRRFASLFAAEYWIAAAVVVGYAALAVWEFPTYARDMLPLVLDLYRPVREPLSDLLSAEVMPWIGLMLIGLSIVARGDILKPAMAIPLMAAAGFLFCVVEQGKGWAYHYYPVAAALAPMLIDRGVDLANARISAAGNAVARLEPIAGFLMAAVGLTFATLTFLGTNKPMRGLMAPIAAVSAHPRMLVISPHFWIGNPLVRDVGGSWAASVPSQWVTLGALYKLGLSPRSEPERQRLIGVIAADRARISADLATRRPDIVLVEHDDRVYPAWFSSPEDLAGFLAGYRLQANYLGIDLWVRSAPAGIGAT